MTFYINVNSTPKLIFDFTIIFSTLIYCMKLIYELTFRLDSDLNFFDIFIILSYILYMFFNFFQSYEDPKTGELVTDNKKMAAKYLKGWFILDFISTIPYEIFFMKYPIFRLIRLIRINKIILFFSFVERVNLKIRKYVALGRLIFFGIFGTFFFSCAWYLVSYYSKDKYKKNFISVNHLYGEDSSGKETKSSYFSLLICFFFSLTTLTTTGFGDYVPLNSIERGFCTLVMIFGIIFFSFLVSLLYQESRTEGDGDGAVADAQRLLTALRGFHRAKENGSLGQEIGNGILSDVIFSVKHARYEENTKSLIFDKMPKKIKCELANYLWKDVFNQFYDYFNLYQEDKSIQEFLMRLSVHFKFKFYNRDSALLSPSNPATEFLLIQSGYVDVVNPVPRLRKRLKPGEGLGIFSILFNLFPPFFYVAASGVEVICITKEELLQEIVEEKVERRLKRACIHRFREILSKISSKHTLGEKGKRMIKIKNVRIGSNNEIIIDEDNEKNNVENIGLNQNNEINKDFMAIKKSYVKMMKTQDKIIGLKSVNEGLNKNYLDSFKMEKFLIQRYNRRNTNNMNNINNNSNENINNNNENNNIDNDNIDNINNN